MIELHSVSKTYAAGQRRLHVLNGIDLTIRERELVSIMGASGSGKSTLLNVLGLLDRFDGGHYTLDGKNVTHLSENEAARVRNHTLGFVFQSFHLLPSKTAAENVALPLYYRGVSSRRRHAAAMEALEQVGLPAAWAEHRPSQLSGGQRQRVAIARAIVGRPRVILADEPTGALDSETSVKILDLLCSLHEQGMTVILVTHDSEVARRTPRLIRIKDGQIVADGGPC